MEKSTFAVWETGVSRGAQLEAPLIPSNTRVPWCRREISERGSSMGPPHEAGKRSSLGQLQVWLVLFLQTGNLPNTHTNTILKDSPQLDIEFFKHINYLILLECLHCTSGHVWTTRHWNHSKIDGFFFTQNSRVEMRQFTMITRTILKMSQFLHILRYSSNNYTIIFLRNNLCFFLRKTLGFFFLWKKKASLWKEAS